MAEYLAVAAGGVPWLGAGTLAQRPAAGVPGRLYVVVEAAGAYLTYDTGASWQLVSDPAA